MAVRFALFAFFALSCSKEPPLFSDFPRTAASNPASKATDTAGSIASDRAVLVALYHATGGDNWDQNDNWLSSEPLNNWYGVWTNYQGRVVYLKLFRNALRGTIPPELGNLDKLEDLRLGDNSLYGMMPPELGNLANLRNMFMVGNSLYGTIPPELGRLNKLEHLRLHDNWLSGSIPPELGRLPNLWSITIGGNRLTGCLPSAWHDVHVDQSSDRGDLGLSLCSEAATTRESSVSDRDVLVALYHATGGINWIINDNWLSNAPLDEWAGVDTDSRGRVRTLWMTGNGLRGRIPPELGRLDKLEMLRLNLNQLRGPIPPQLGNLDNLKWLLLGDNLLTGSIPSQLGNLDNLIQLLLGDNRLSGTIPSQLGHLDQLVFLELQNNLLTGSIPSQLGQLTNLLEVEISGNFLTGCVPSEWSDLYDHNVDFDKAGLDFCGDSAGSSGEFDIELVYLDNGLSSARKNLMAKAARRWEQVIIGDLPDINFRGFPHNEWDDFLQARIRVSYTVDDVRVFVRAHPISSLTSTDSATAGTGFSLLIRTSDSLPILSAIRLNTDVLDDLEADGWLEDLMLHELGHCLGVGISWGHFGLLYNSSRQNHTADTYFAGFQARQAFDQFGGRSYRGRKVPVQQGGDDVHWRTSVFGDELMTLGWTWPYHAPLSRITVASLADIGYEVNWDAADAYRVPSTSAAKPVAAEAPPRCHVVRRPIHVVAEDGRVLDTIDP